MNIFLILLIVPVLLSASVQDEYYQKNYIMKNDARFAFQISAFHFYELLRYLPTSERVQVIADISLDDIKQTVENVKLVERDKLEMDEDGNEDPIAKNFSYPDQQQKYKYGLIYINKNKFLKSKNKITQACHEILGLYGLDRSYESCTKFDRFSGQILTLSDRHDGLDRCSMQEFFRIELSDLLILENERREKPGTLIFFLSFKEKTYQVNHDLSLIRNSTKSDKETRLKIASMPFFVPESNLTEGVLSFNLIMEENNFFSKTKKLVFPIHLPAFTDYSIDQFIHIGSNRFSHKANANDYTILQQEDIRSFSSDTRTYLSDFSSYVHFEFGFKVNRLIRCVYNPFLYAINSNELINLNRQVDLLIDQHMSQNSNFYISTDYESLYEQIRPISANIKLFKEGNNSTKLIRKFNRLLEFLQISTFTSSTDPGRQSGRIPPEDYFIDLYIYRN